MLFDWFRSDKREKQRKVRLDRKHLEDKARRFLKSYLDADETRKLQFYRAVEEASRQCQPQGLVRMLSELEDSQIAEATSNAAMDFVLVVRQLPGKVTVREMGWCIRWHSLQRTLGSVAPIIPPAYQPLS